MGIGVGACCVRAWWTCVSRGRQGEWCERWPRWASFCVAGAGNRARHLKQLDSVAQCEKSALRARVHALGVAKSWQAQGIRGLVDVSLERTFLGTQWQAVGIGVACAALCRGTQWQAVGIGVGRVACDAVSWGLLGRASSGWRCVIGIGGQGVLSVALCHWDWLAGRRVGGAVSLRLLGRASCRWRRVFQIGDQGIVWVALCRGDCWAGRRLGDAVSLGLLIRASCGWRRVCGIADQGVM